MGAPRAGPRRIAVNCQRKLWRSPAGSSGELPPADLQVVGLRKSDRMIRLRRDLVVQGEAGAERLAHGLVELRSLDPARAAGGDQRAAGADLARDRAVQLAIRGEHRRDL